MHCTFFGVTMAKIFKFCPKIMVHFCLLNQQVSASDKAKTLNTNTICTNSIRKTSFNLWNIFDWFLTEKVFTIFGQKFVNFGHSGGVRILLRCGSCRAKRVSNTSQGDLLRWVKQYFSSFWLWGWSQSCKTLFIFYWMFCSVFKLKQVCPKFV